MVSLLKRIDFAFTAANVASTAPMQKISIKTRQYAKRQATWSRSYMADWTKIPNDEIKIFVKNFKQAILKLDQ